MVSLYLSLCENFFFFLRTNPNAAWPQTCLCMRIHSRQYRNSLWHKYTRGQAGILQSKKSSSAKRLGVLTCKAKERRVSFTFWANRSLWRIMKLSSRQPPSIKLTQDKLVSLFSVVLLYVAWKRGLPPKFACFVLLRPITKRSFNLLCVLDLAKHG